MSYVIFLSTVCITPYSLYWSSSVVLIIISGSHKAAVGVSDLAVSRQHDGRPEVVEQPAQGEGLLRGVQLREHRGDARLLGEIDVDG